MQNQITNEILYESQKMYALLQNRAATVKERYLLLQLLSGLLLGALTLCNWYHFTLAYPPPQKASGAYTESSGISPELM